MAIMSIGYSQITLLKEIKDVAPLGWIGTGNTSEVQGVYTFDGAKITIYDCDFNVIRAINTPSQITDISFLFKNVYTSSGKYEYIATKKVGEQNYYYLYNEDGNMIFNFEEYMPYFFFDNKFITQRYVVVEGVVKWSYRLYQLSGTTDISEMPGQTIAMHPFPNPAAEIVNIPYSTTTIETLVIYDSGGNVVDSVALDPQATNVQLPTVNFAKGVYFYQYGAKSGKFLVK